MFLPNQLSEYLADAAQRTVLFWDVMRERGNQYNEHIAKTEPNVLAYDYEVIMSGGDLPRPVNYGLVRIPAPEGIEIDPKKRPFVVIDPRAGHGPGIGGFKADSEIGVAMRAGHQCYFIGFLPEPLEGQTIEDVMLAEVAFLEKVISLHPEADGKPTVIGNCQAGWAVMMLASYRPDLCGPVIVAGAPLTYWAGVHGENPMRYSGGMLGGTWLTALTGDLGAGRFDGAWLVANFEGMNPANTLWSKQYNVYKNVDTERDRYLGFEKWWGGHVILNAEEMQWITDNLFVGNKLPTGKVETTDGIRLDYRNIRSPIICFCSQGDNITPPQQALGWILDLYADVDEIRACEQTIIYTVHPSIGHLGIFVSGSVAKKEHREFASNVDFIDCLPPGLYEAVLSEKSEDMVDADLVTTSFITRFEARTLDDIRALGTNDEADERRFAAVARLSEINTGLYRTLAQPFVQAMVTPAQAELAIKMHPLRIGYEIFSDKNPAMASVERLAEAVRANRTPVAANNPFWDAQEAMSKQIIQTLDSCRDMRDATIEAWFMAFFGNPVLQAALGLGDGSPRAKPGIDPERLATIKRSIENLKARMGDGGVREACLRSMLFIRMPEGVADVRRFELLRQLRKGDDTSLKTFKQMVREQFYMLLVDEHQAVSSIPDLLVRAEADEIHAALDIIRRIAKTGGEPEGEVAGRLTEIEAIFEGALASSNNVLPLSAGE